jgi:hypothetical protein
LGAKLKAAAKSFTTIPPPPGTRRETPTTAGPGGAGPSMLDVLKRKDAERERLMQGVREPQHLTDQFGPSRFPTMNKKPEDPNRKDDKKKKPP